MPSFPSIFFYFGAFLCAFIFRHMSLKKLSFFSRAVHRFSVNYLSNLIFFNIPQTIERKLKYAMILSRVLQPMCGNKGEYQMTHSSIPYAILSIVDEWIEKNVSHMNERDHLFFLRKNLKYANTWRACILHAHPFQMLGKKINSKRTEHHQQFHSKFKCISLTFA